MELRIDANGEDAPQHIRNALTILGLADTVVVDTRFPERNGMVRLTANEAAAIRSRLRKALALLQDR